MLFNLHHVFVVLVWWIFFFYQKLLSNTLELAMAEPTSVAVVVLKHACLCSLNRTMTLCKSNLRHSSSYNYYVVPCHRPFLPSTWPAVIPTTQTWSLLQCFPYYVCCSSVAVFCSAFVEYFPGMASEIFFKSFVATLVAPIITSVIIHFMFRIRPLLQ